MGKIKARTSSQISEYFFLPDVCQLRSRQHRPFGDAEREICPSPTCSKIVLESTWKNKVS